MSSMSSGETQVPVEAQRAYAPSRRADVDDVSQPEAVVQDDVVVIETHDAADDRDLDALERREVPESAGPALTDDTESSPWRAGGAVSAGDERWSEIKAIFVDDPGESVKLAAGMVDRAIENLMSALRQRQDSLASSEADDTASTEELRNALRGYQNLFGQLDAMSGQFRAHQDPVSGS
jgi:hypothetical protein